MSIKIPELIMPGSKLLIEEDAYLERPDVRERAIYILGNREGFMSLMHFLIWASHEMTDDINISRLSFVNSTVKKDLVVELNDDEGCELTYGSIVEKPNSYYWNLTESELSVCATQLHGLWYLSWDHLHFDPVTIEATHALWCGLE